MKQDPPSNIELSLPQLWSRSGQAVYDCDPAAFRVAVHRSTIVQIDRVRELLPDFHGDFTLILRTGARLTLSRNYRAKLEAMLGRQL